MGLLSNIFGDGDSDWLGFGDDVLSSVGAGVLGLGGQIAGGLFGLSNSKEMADYNAKLQKELSAYNLDLTKSLHDYDFEISKKGADYAKNLRDKSLTETPGLTRAGLLAAGFNPILAVNSAAGQPFSQSIGSSGGSAGASGVSGSNSPLRVDVLESLRNLSMIRQNDAQTDLIKRRTLSEGWVVKTLSRSEAEGLGASVANALGFNFRDSSANTFLVAYNPITGELRNLGDTEGGLGTFGRPTNAAEVIVDWPDGSSDTYTQPAFHDYSEKSYINVKPVRPSKSRFYK